MKEKIDIVNIYVMTERKKKRTYRNNTFITFSYGMN
jgi:hypothetical protein